MNERPKCVAPTKAGTIWRRGEITCGLNAKHEHEGKPYCGKHYPPTIAARRERTRQVFVAQHAYEDAQQNARVAERELVDAVVRHYPGSPLVIALLAARAEVSRLARQSQEASS